MMRLAAPEWLILLPVIMAIGWRWPVLGLGQPLRALCLGLGLLVLVRPEMRLRSEGLDLWVLVDRSASAADAMARNLTEWETLLARSMSPDDRLVFVDYSDVPVVRGEGTGEFAGSTQHTRTALAVEYALAQLDRGRVSRLLALTDGYSTEPLGGIGERLQAEGVRLDTRTVTLPDAVDYAVDGIVLPTKALPGEPFLIEAEISGSPDGDVPYEVRRGGGLLTRGTAAVRGGTAVLRFTDRIRAGGAHRYEIRLTPAQDGRSGNNAAENWIEIATGPRVLLVTAYADDPLESSLRALGLEVETITDAGTLDPGRLAGAKAVILNNVPASEVSGDFLASLDFFVRSQGGGLLMVGGKTSFGSGGYFASAIDELLPVSMELRTEHRQLAVAMAIVMDRSGSMSAGVIGGMTKMDLANEGAARSIELLGPQDSVSVLAVDSEPQIVVPMTRLDSGVDDIASTVRRITSGGGGIYVYNGLQAGWRELQKSDAGQRHLILFADAADAEQPDAFRTLIAEMTAQSTTISVIGLGSESDQDADFLKEIAALGGGRIFFNSDAATLPALFEQETVAVARSAFLENPVGVKGTAGWLELAAQQIDWPAEIDGYNLSYLRPEATAAAVSKDEYGAPLVAFWQRGIGRAAAVSFPLGGPFSARVRAWPGYGDFVQTLSRWLFGTELPPGLGLRTRVDGSQLEIDLLFDSTWQERFAQEAPTLVVADGVSGEARTVVWERLEPGRYRASIPLVPGQWIRGAVQAGGSAFAFGPVVAGANPEWALRPESRRELEAASRQSGGVERVDLSTIWDASRIEEFRDLRVWLLVAFLACFVMDAIATRLGWQMPVVALPRFSRPIRRSVVTNANPDLTAEPPAGVPAEAGLPHSGEPDEPAGETRIERFRRAKRGGK